MIVVGKLSRSLESNSLLPLFQVLYKRDLLTCDALLTLSHHLQVTLNGGMKVSWTTQRHLIELVTTVF